MAAIPLEAPPLSNGFVDKFNDITPESISRRGLDGL